MVFGVGARATKYRSSQHLHLRSGRSFKQDIKTGVHSVSVSLKSSLLQRRMGKKKNAINISGKLKPTKLVAFFLFIPLLYFVVIALYLSRFPGLGIILFLWELVE